jgi:hypothetical protein
VPVPADQLQCGVHPPLFYAARDELPPAGVTFHRWRWCSGKPRNAGLPGILVPLFPTWRSTIRCRPRFARRSRLAGVAEASLVAGIDGLLGAQLCGAAVALASPSRARRDRRLPLRTGAADSGRRNECASGNGVR